MGVLMYDSDYDTASYASGDCSVLTYYCAWKTNHKDELDHNDPYDVAIDEDTTYCVSVAVDDQCYEALVTPNGPNTVGNGGTNDLETQL